MDPLAPWHTPVQPHVMVATPCFGGLVTQRYMVSTMALMQYGDRAGWSVSLELLGYDSLITRSRNTLVSRFLDNPQATHLLFIDADIGFEVEQVVRMLSLDQDVVAGLYPLKLIDWQTGGLARAVGGEPVDTAPLRYVGTPLPEGEREERHGFVTGVYAGTGFMLLKRDAVLAVIQANPHLRYRGTHTAVAPARDRDEYAIFDCMICPDTGVYLSEDYAFCRRWRDLGGAIWLDTVGALTHVGPHEFRGAPRARFPDAGQRGAFAMAAE